MYRMARLLSTLPVGEDMEQLLNYYLNNMLMSASVKRYDCCYAVLLTLVYLVAILGFIVRCVGGSKAPPVLHSSYRTDFERDCAV